jgi:hypothetical protein
MALRELVAFAQRFQVSDPRLIDDANVEAQLGLRAREAVPQWVQNIDAGQLVSHWGAEWSIHGSKNYSNIDHQSLNPDELAYYLPFHFYGRGRWGIFVKASGIVSLASYGKGDRLVPGDERYLEVAKIFLFDHELFHFIVEVASTRAEILARRPLYDRLFLSHDAGILEEAIATAFSFARSPPMRDDWEDEMWTRLRDLLRLQGAGYRDFEQWLTAGQRAYGKEQLVSFLTEPLPGPRPKASNSLHSFLFRGGWRYSSVPVKTVDDLAPDEASIWRPFPKYRELEVIVHSNEHPPPHIHVRALSDERWVRYDWPRLALLDHDQSLSSSDYKKLEEYCERYCNEITDRISKVFGGHLDLATT